LVDLNFSIMEDWAGWLLVLFSFSIVLMWKHVRSDTKVVHAIWFCIVLHHAVAFLNAYVGNVLGAKGDNGTAHTISVELAALPEPEWIYGTGLVIYTQFVGLFYRAFGASLLLGEELSILAFALSCVVLVKLVNLLDMRRFRVGIVLLFGLLPSAVIFRSLTFRESWQALFFLLAVYWAVRLRKRGGILIVSFLLMSGFCLSLLHWSLSYYAMYLIAISVYWGIFCRKKGVQFLFTGLLVACVIILVQKMGWFMTVAQAFEDAKYFRQRAIDFVDARAVYGVMLDTSSVLGFVTTTPMVFVQYMFAPFPWQVENVKDICAMLESMLRFVLLFFAVFSWRRSSSEVRSYYSFLLIAVLAMEFVWALGTVNWGTAARHHVLGYSVIVLLGGPGLIQFMWKLHLKLHFWISGRRKVSISQDREIFVKSDPKINEML